MAGLVPLGKRVIDAFGGPVKMAEATGWPISTIESWKSKDSIPRWRLRDIRNAAQANRVMLPDDFPNVLAGGAHGGKSNDQYSAARPQQSRGQLRENESGGVAATGFDGPVVSYVTKAGDNFALVMSPRIAERAGLSEGSRVEIESVDDGRIVVTRSKRHFTLDELLAGMTPEREHPLEDEAPRGEETL